MSGLFSKTCARATTGLVIIVWFLLTLSACSKVTHENYRKIQVGMEYSQVAGILGEPSRCDSVLSAKTCTWGKKDKSITIQFVADKVVFFSSRGI